MAEISWIKLSTGLPDNKKIKRIRKLPDGDKVILFWVFLLARAGESNKSGGLFLTDTMPYSEEDLSADFDFTVEFVRFALLTLEKYAMISRYEDVLFIKNWEEYQAIEGMEKVREQTRLRVAKHREKQKEIGCNVTGNATVTECNGTDIELDKEKERDKEKPRKYSDEHLRLATKLRDNLKEDFPKRMGKANLDKWSDDMRLMQEQDNRTTEQIEYVLDWLPTNDFWFGNILSVGKLRKQFDKLVYEIKKDKGRLNKKVKTSDTQKSFKETQEKLAKLGGNFDGY